MDRRRHRPTRWGSTVPAPVPAPVLAAVLATLLATLMSGCVSMPDTGPIVEIEQRAQDDAEPGTFYDPSPPRRGATRQEIVGGFLEAMKATPMRTSVAAQFLATGAQNTWSPEAGIITYGSARTVPGRRNVPVRLTDAQVYDERGAWVRTMPEDRARVGFALAREEGEWRITRAPDALVVPSDWLEDRYQRLSLYFLDPSGSILVPEPVQVPRGDQAATVLVRGLMAGPSEESAGVARSFVPDGVGLAASSVPISGEGVAEVALKGRPDSDPVGVLTDQFVAQLTWTLRQEPRVRAIRVVLDGQVLARPDGSTEIPMDSGSAFEPTDAQASSDLFMLREGLLVSGPLGAATPVPGPFGTQDYGLRSVAVSPDGSMVAGVSGSGDRLLLASVEDPETPVVALVTGARDLLTPTWDHAGRMWVADRRPGGTVFSLVNGARVRAVTVPGASGQTVRRVLVSRDGSRLVTVVRVGREDRLQVNRVRQHEGGRVLGLTPARRIFLDQGVEERITDVGWRSATSLAVLRPVVEDLLQVRVVSVDGAPGAVSPSRALRRPGRDTRVVSSPAPGDVAYVLGPEDLTDVDDLARNIARPADVSWLTYVG